MGNITSNDSLGDRMKCYEYVTRTYLTRRTPVIVRIDGKAFHTFTRNFQRPYDQILLLTMQQTMKYLCENIEGCVLGYTQSDEITLVLCDYKELTTQAWFSNNIQKICSVSASMATLAFNSFFAENVDKTAPENEVYQFCKNKALFDSRVFNIPKEEVGNCLLWRQRDATRNSILSIAGSFFPLKQMHGLNGKQLQEKLFQDKGINWNDYPTTQKRGSCCIKVEYEKKDNESSEVLCKRSNWVIDNEIPIFSEDWDYIEKRITF